MAVNEELVKSRVWVKAGELGTLNNRRSRRLRLHTDPDCPRLSTANRVTEHDPDEYPDDQPVCSWCNGDVQFSHPGWKTPEQRLKEAGLME